MVQTVPAVSALDTVDLIVSPTSLLALEVTNRVTNTKRLEMGRCIAQPSKRRPASGGRCPLAAPSPPGLHRSPVDFYYLPYAQQYN